MTNSIIYKTRVGNQSKRLWISLPIIMLWLAGVIVAFWWFQFRHLQAFGSDQTVFFNGHDLRVELRQLAHEAAAEGKEHTATVVHFYNPDCPCNRFNEVHVQALITKYGAQGVHFVVLVPATSPAQQNANLARARKVFHGGPVTTFRVAGDISVPSSPGVAVLDAQAQLAYFGPYSLGAGCGVNNGAFVETVLDKLFHGNNPGQVNMAAVGCYCPWPGMRTT